MLIRKPRGTSPFTLGVVIIVGVLAGGYIWSPLLTKYLNEDPEVLAFREKAKRERELEELAKKFNCSTASDLTAMHHLKNVFVQSRRLASSGHGASGRPVTLEQLKQMIPSAVLYGSAATVGCLYFTDWKLVLQYLPFYNGKFKEE